MLCTVGPEPRKGSPIFGCNTGGDQDKDGDDWNLMCSFYPRTHKVQFNAMAFYQQTMMETDSLSEAMDNLYSRIASILIEGLDLVRSIPPLPKGDQSQLEALYQWALKFQGSHLEKLFSKPSIEKLLATKREKGLV